MHTNHFISFEKNKKKNISSMCRTECKGFGFGFDWYRAHSHAHIYHIFLARHYNSGGLCCSIRLGRDKNNWIIHKWRGSGSGSGCCLPTIDESSTFSVLLHGVPSASVEINWRLTVLCCGVLCCAVFCYHTGTIRSVLISRCWNKIM